MKGVLMKVGQMVSFIAEGLPDEAQQALAALQADAAPMAPSLAAEVDRERARRRARAGLRRAGRTCRSPRRASARSTGPRRTTAARSPSRCSSPASREAIEEDLDGAEVMYSVFSALALNGLDARGPRRRAAGRGCARSSTTASRPRNIAEFAGHFAGHPWVRIPTLAPELSTAKVLTTEWIDGHVVGPVRRHRLDADQAARRRGDLALRPALDPAPRRVQRRSAPRQLPLPPRRQRDVPRLRARQALGATASGSASSRPRRHRRRTATRSALVAAMETPGSSPPDHGLDPAAGVRLRVDARTGRTSSTSSRSPATGCATRSAAIFDIDGPYADVIAKLNMPPSFVILDRVVWGVSAILGKLEASRPVAGRCCSSTASAAPPATELGAAELSWRS